MATTADTVTIQDLATQIGRESVSDWVEVSQDMINKFADATGDHQFIHVNPEMAKMTPFGGTIAHGFPDAVADAAARVEGRPAADRGREDGRQLRRQQSPLPHPRAVGQQACAAASS